MSYEKKSNLGLSTHLEFFETIYTHFNRNDCFNVKLRFFAKAAQNDSLFVEQIPSPPLIPPLQQSWTQAVKRGSLSRTRSPLPVSSSRLLVPRYLVSISYKLTRHCELFCR
jgi:hypothetical protein